MTADPLDNRGFSLRRWSQRKLAARTAAREDGGRDGATQAAGAPASETAVTDARANPITAPDGSVDVAAPAPGAHAEALPAHPHATGAPLRVDPAERPPLPPVDSLGIESDFSAFMQPGVDESLKRGALKKLFSDPRFNVMDGLDVYIDDYSKPDPIDPAIVRTLAQARYIFNPPATRVTAEGYVEDIPEEELRAAAREADSETAAEPNVAGQDAVAEAEPPVAQPQDDAVPAAKTKPEAA